MPVYRTDKYNPLQISMPVYRTEMLLTIANIYACVQNWTI